MSTPVESPRRGANGAGTVVPQADRSQTARPNGLLPPPREPPAGWPCRLLVALLVGVFLILGGLGYARWRAPSAPGPFVASGTLEADEVLVGSQVAGQIVELATEGQFVAAGEQVARLDDSLIQIQIRQAQTAERIQLANQADRYLLRPPTAGVVTRVPVRVGEVVAPGQTVLAVADLTQLKLTAYILERDLGRVRVGQDVSISADPFPGRAFAGQVSSINQRAEFTPRNVQTQRDRLNLVFGVKVRVANPDLALKPGMPADATFLP